MRSTRNIADRVVPMETGQGPSPHRNSAAATGEVSIDRKRYRKIRWFFAKILWQTIWWDIIFKLPVLKWFRPAPLPRWQSAAGQYRELAIHMGGILIKLGQFLSTRVDLLPPEITGELTRLQDEVAPDPFEEIVKVIEADFRRPIDEIFDHFARTPVGSASLAQAHLAVLSSGEEVAVKVLRPNIHMVVETDLKAMRMVSAWLKRFKNIRARMDLDVLLDEFAATTWEELDMLKEKENLKRFAADFAESPHVYTPRIYTEFCSTCTLTLENVSYIKINDIKAIKSCGILTSRLADRLYDIYMHQIFVSNYVHVDPHPGNLFVKPLPHPEEIEDGTTEFAPGDQVPYKKDRSFQVVFIDFGMMAEISEKLKAAMRMGAIGLGTRDARKIVQAYVIAGFLRHGAELRRLEEAHQAWLQKLWGLRLGKLQEASVDEIRYFLQEYRDLIMETPFQMQADMLFAGRAVGILVGLSTTIDPEFDPWSKTLTYAKQFAKEELTGEWQGIREELFMIGKHFRTIPAELESVLTRAKQGALTVQVSLSPETRRSIRRIDLSVKRFAWMVITAALLISGVNLHIAGKDLPFGIALIVLSGATFLWGMRRW